MTTTTIPVKFIAFPHECIPAIPRPSGGRQTPNQQASKSKIATAATHPQFTLKVSPYSFHDLLTRLPVDLLIWPSEPASELRQWAFGPGPGIDQGAHHDQHGEPGLRPRRQQEVDDPEEHQGETELARPWKL